MRQTNSLLGDPIFYGTLLFLSLLTTLMPAALGQSWLLPLFQSIGLTLFLAMAIRTGSTQSALLILVLWLGSEIIAMSWLSWLLPARAAQAISNGFDYRVALLSWFYADNPAPSGYVDSLTSRLLEWIVFLLGSLLTGGFLGAWQLTHTADLVGYTIGSLLQAFTPLRATIIGLPIWNLLRLLGEAGLMVVLAQPLWRRDWAIGALIQRHRRLLFISIGLILIGWLLEMILPGMWRIWFQVADSVKS